MASGQVVWDDRLEAIFGLPPGGYDQTFETWLGSDPPGRTVRATMQIVNEAVEAPSSYSLNVRIVWPGRLPSTGSSRWGRVTTNDAGDPTGTIGCVWDTTARRESEQELAAAFRAQQQASDLADEMSLDREKLMIRLSEIADHLQTSLAASPIPAVEGVSIASSTPPVATSSSTSAATGTTPSAPPTGATRVRRRRRDGAGREGRDDDDPRARGIRGLLTVDPSPEVVLSHADVVLDRDAPEQFVTAVVALVDPAAAS